MADTICVFYHVVHEVLLLLCLLLLLLLLLLSTSDTVSTHVCVLQEMLIVTSAIAKLGSQHDMSYDVSHVTSHSNK